MNTVRRLRFRAFVAADECYHVARTEIPQGAPPIHTHDFAEVFWLEHGRGLHLLNGQRLPLEAGDLVWIQPTDVHGFQARDAAGCTLLNVAFAATTLAFLRTRYLGGARLPAPRRLERAELTRYSRGADALASGRQTQLRLDTFLLNLLQGARSEAEPVDVALYPGWLQDALRAFAQPAQLDGGTTGLARLAGRCPEHVNRVIRQLTGKTATDVVNEQRLGFAARQLRMTDRKILDIALECGLGNLGYFYRLFAKQFGVTPRQYRLRQQALVR